jgi:hypothetical protein
VGDGRTYLYTKTDASITPTLRSDQLSVNVAAGDTWWSGMIGARPGTALVPGYYTPISSGTGGADQARLNWSESLGCVSYSGWFTLDSLVTSPAGELLSFDLRFEQHCPGLVPALRGKVHWERDDGVVPAGPRPIPAGLWNPPVGATPEGINYVYLEGDPGGTPAWRGSWLYTKADASISAYLNEFDPSEIMLVVRGDEDWTGRFEAMSFVDTPQVGFYPGPTEPTNPVLGGLSVSGLGLGCGSVGGALNWFAVDGITVEDVAVEAGSTEPVLTSLDLRFEQRCDASTAALRGKIHLGPGDPSSPPGPVYPPPADLWNAPAGATPSAGSYVYLQSDAGDPIGGGRTVVYTPEVAYLRAGTSQNYLHVTIDGADTSWVGAFEVPAWMTSFQPGFYRDVAQPGGGNPTRGAMMWSADRFCTRLTGWFVLDGFTFSSKGALTSLDARFEQHCEGIGPALRGEVHWVAP